MIFPLGAIFFAAAPAAAQSSVTFRDLGSTAPDLVIYQTFSGAHALMNEIFAAVLGIFVAIELVDISVSVLVSQLDGSGRRKRFLMFYARFALVILAFASYNGLFEWIVYLFDSIANALMAQAPSWGNALQLFHSTSSPVGFSSFSLKGLVQGVLSLLVTPIDVLFFGVRYIFLGLLYCLGPLCFAAGVSSIGAPVVKNWFKALVQVASWAVFFGMMKVLMEPFTSTLTASGAIGVSLGYYEAVIEVTMLVFVLFIPKIAAVIINGEHMGMMASMVYGAAAVGAAAEGGAKGADLHSGALSFAEAALGITQKTTTIPTAAPSTAASQINQVPAQPSVPTEGNP